MQPQPSTLVQALQACNAVPEAQATARGHLQAQLQYRLGNHQEAIRLYDELATHKVNVCGSCA